MGVSAGRRPETADAANLADGRSGGLTRLGSELRGDLPRPAHSGGVKELGDTQREPGHRGARLRGAVFRTSQRPITRAAADVTARLVRVGRCFPRERTTHRFATERRKHRSTETSSVVASGLGGRPILVPHAPRRRAPWWRKTSWSASASDVVGIRGLAKARQTLHPSGVRRILPQAAYLSAGHGKHRSRNKCQVTSERQGASRRYCRQPGRSGTGG